MAAGDERLSGDGGDGGRGCLNPNVLETERCDASKNDDKFLSDW